jgi:hypothetical protein
MHNDADELRLSPWKGVSLNQAISFADAAGYNAIDFTIVNFKPTKEGYSPDVGLDKFFYDFEFADVPGNMQQIKGWKNVGRIELASSGGHHARFNNQNLYPLKFITKHYPLRSSAHALKKIFNERLNQLSPAEKARGWHNQYNRFSKKSTFIVENESLNKFSPSSFYNEYLVERLSGIGIRVLPRVGNKEEKKPKPKNPTSFT